MINCIKIIPIRAIETKYVPLQETKTKVVNSNVNVTGGGTNDYGQLTGKPQINSVTLKSGNNTFEELGIVNDKNFVFEQKTASQTWIINHNLAKFPSVSVVDSGGTVVIGDIEYIDMNNLVATFVAKFAGTAYLN